MKVIYWTKSIFVVSLILNIVAIIFEAKMLDLAYFNILM